MVAFSHARIASAWTREHLARESAIFFIIDITVIRLTFLHQYIITLSHERELRGWGVAYTLIIRLSTRNRYMYNISVPKIAGPAKRCWAPRAQGASRKKNLSIFCNSGRLPRTFTKMSARLMQRDAKFNSTSISCTGNISYRNVIMAPREFSLFSGEISIKEI